MVEQMTAPGSPFDGPLKGLRRNEVLMQFEYQAMLILLAFILPVAGIFLRANKGDRRLRETGDVTETGHNQAFHAAPTLDDESDAAAFLTSALATPSQEPLQSTIRAAVEARGIAQLAEETGLPRGEIEDALTSGGRPSYDTVVMILHGFGYQLRVEPRQPGCRSPGT